MKKKNHLLFGIIFVLAFIFVLNLFKLDIFAFTLPSILIILVITALYSILPDIDHKNSTITWWFFGIGVFGLGFGIMEIILKQDFIDPIRIIFISSVLLIATYLAVVLFKHRGFIHSIPVGLLAVLPLYLLIHSYAYCSLAYVAWHSHLIGDGYFFKIK